MYGTNDSWVDAGQTASRLSERAYTENLREIVRRLRAAGARVVLMTPPMFAEENPRNGLGEDPNLRLASFAAACRAVAIETGVPLVDHFAGWAAIQSRGESLQPWTTDGCHPNEAGHSDLSVRLLPAVLPVARQLSP
jgi:acyl-CoA thioesterase-1